MSIYDDEVDQAPLNINLGMTAERAADLLETCRAGDVDAAVADLEQLLPRMVEASKARRLLCAVRPDVLREAMEMTARRQRDVR